MVRHERSACPPYPPGRESETRTGADLMPLSLVPLERSFRATGCDARCEVVQALLPGRFGRSELLLHDPTAHEEYGRGIASLLGDAARLGAVHSGGIAIDLDACTVSRDGSPLAVSPSE